MNKNMYLCWGILLLGLVKCAHSADLPPHPWLYKSVLGVAAHDRGPFSDRHENGVDLNGELQFNPPTWQAWQWLGSPNPMVGFTANLNGDTSLIYAGISYELSLSNSWTDELTGNLTRHLFVGGSVAAAIHSGPLHKDPVGCLERSDCGFGHRVLPRFSLEVGTRLGSGHKLSIYYEHMSHKYILSGENEGIDSIGIRYHLPFGKR